MRLAPTQLPPLQRRGSTLLLILLLALAALRLLVREGLAIDLHYDEAQYAFWSFFPDWGYYSKPPMIAWSIAAARMVCGDSAFCVRMPSAIAFTLTPLVVYAIGRRLWPQTPRAAWVAALLLAASPLVNFYALFITTDALLLLCWSLALLLLVMALQEGRGWMWGALGLVLGAGLLSKYTMGIFAVSAAMALLAIPALRTHLRRPGPWLAMSIAAAMLTPNLLWNAANGFPTLHHTAEISGVGRKESGGGLLRFLVEQVVVFGPLAFAALVAAAVVGWREDTARQDPVPPVRLLLCFTLPFFAIIAAQAGLSRAFANWASPTYVGGSLLAAWWLTRSIRAWPAVAAIGVSALLSMVAYASEPLSQRLGIDWQSPLADLRGWRAMGQSVERVAEERGATLVCDDRKLCSELAFYAGPAGRALRSWNPEARRNDHFRLTRDLAAAPATGPFLVISERDLGPALAASFAQAQPLDAPLEMPSRKGPQPLHLWLATDFRGYR